MSLERDLHWIWMDIVSISFRCLIPPAHRPGTKFRRENNCSKKPSVKLRAILRFTHYRQKTAFTKSAKFTTVDSLVSVVDAVRVMPLMLSCHRDYASPSGMRTSTGEKIRLSRKFIQKECTAASPTRSR